MAAAASGDDACPGIARLGTHSTGLISFRFHLE